MYWRLQGRHPPQAAPIYTVHVELREYTAHESGVNGQLIGSTIADAIKEYILVIEERLWVNIGEKNFALILFRCNIVEVRVNANVVIPENLVVVH